MPKKLYDVLDVSEDASAADIRRAYRRKVKESHPDVSDEPDAAETFQLIVTARDVLTDAEERERYDDLGHEAYMDWFGEDGSNGGSADGSASSTGPSDSSETGADPGEDASVDDSSGTADTSGSSGGADGVDFGEQTSGSSGGGSSGNSTSGTTGSSSASSSTESSTSTGASKSTEPSSSSSDASATSGTASNSTPENSSSGASGTQRSTRESSGAVSESAVAEEAERTRKQWQAASRSGGPDDATSPWSTSSSQGEHLAAERVETGIATKIRSRDAIEMTLVMLISYPLFLFAAMWDGFPMAVRLTVGVLTVVLLLYTLTEPVVGVVVFGIWSTLTPLLMLFTEMDLLSPFGLFALTVTWVPFLLALLLILAMPE